MIVAAHQPYFFPYIGYFSLISAADNFVFFDVSQYTRQSWMSRNRILKPGLNDFVYIKIGLQKMAYKAMLPDCKLTTDEKWKARMMAQLEHFKKKAPFYNETIAVLHQILEEKEETLVEFNVKSTTVIASLLNIKTPLQQFSTMKQKVKEVEEGENWGLNISKALGADAYINAPAGEALYPKEVFDKAGIRLGFIQHQLNPYKQNNSRFIPGLSIIDVLLFNGIERTSEMVHDYAIKWVN